MPAEEPNASGSPALSLKPPFAILLNGTSSAGKTSLARALQSQSSTPVLHASLDTFTDMYAWDSITDAETSRRCHANSVHNFHNALKLFARGPHALVIDHIFERPAWYEATREALGELRTYYIGVHCALSVLAAREQSRPDRRPGLAALQFNLVHQNMSYDFEIDTSQETPESGADKIMDFIRKSPPEA